MLPRNQGMSVKRTRSLYCAPAHGTQVKFQNGKTDAKHISRKIWHRNHAFFMQLGLLISKEVTFCKVEEDFTCAINICIFQGISKYIYGKLRNVPSAKMTVALNFKSPPHNICWKVFSLFRITFVFQEKPEVIVICEL